MLTSEERANLSKKLELETSTVSTKYPLQESPLPMKKPTWKCLMLMLGNTPASRTRKSENVQFYQPVHGVLSYLEASAA
jgi:hypothetical protein